MVPLPLSKLRTAALGTLGGGNCTSLRGLAPNLPLDSFVVPPCPLLVLGPFARPPFLPILADPLAGHLACHARPVPGRCAYPP